MSSSTTSASRTLPAQDSAFLRTSAIAMSTFREAVRDKVLLGVVGFATALLFFALVLSNMALNEDQRLIIHVGHAVLSLFAVLTAVFLGSSLLYKEIERKTIYVILPKPIARHEFVLGKYFGIVLTGCAFLAATGAVHNFILAAKAGAPSYTFTLFPLIAFALFGLYAWRFRSTSEAVLLAGLLGFALSFWACSFTAANLALLLYAKSLMLLEVLLVVAVAMLFSSFSTPFLTGLMTAGIWLLGRQADAMATVRSRVLPDVVRELLHGVAAVVPNFSLYVPHDRVLTEAFGPMQNPARYVGGTALYSIAYAACLLLVACTIFRKRSFA